MAAIGSVIEVAGPRAPAAAPPEGERTQRQRAPIGWGWPGGMFGGTGMPPALGAPGFDGATTGIGWAGAACESFAITTSGYNQLGPIWQLIYLPSYSTYRLMRDFAPALALARSIVFSPIIGAQRTAESVSKNDPAPEPWIKFAQDRLVPTYVRSVPDMLRGLDFGHAKFEKIWQMVEGLWEYERLKALIPEGAQILTTREGAFAGLRPAAASADGTQDLAPVKSFLYTYDGEGGDLLGRSRFENVRATAWADWIDTMLASQKLKNKLAGILPIFYHPPGSFEDPPGSGRWIPFQDACRNAGEQLKRGEFLTIEHMGWSDLDVKNNPDLLKMGRIFVDFYDAGNYSPAQAGMISQLQYDDRNLMRGYLVPERAGLEATGSASRADSATQSTTGSQDGEVITADLDEQFRRGAIDEVMVFNFGERARGKVKITTAPLVDENIEIYRSVLSDLIKAGLAGDVADSLDMDKLFKGMDLPTLKKFVISRLVTPPAPGSPPGPGGGGGSAGGTPPPGGNGSTGRNLPARIGGNGQ